MRRDVDNKRLAKYAWWLFFLGEGFHTYGVTGNIFQAVGDAFLYGALWLTLFLMFSWAFLPTLESLGKHAIEYEENEEEEDED